METLPPATTSAGFIAHTAYLVGGGLLVYRRRAGGHVGHGVLLGEVDRGVQGARGVDEGRQDLNSSQGRAQREKGPRAMIVAWCLNKQRMLL